MALTPSFASLFIGFKKKAPEPRAPDKKKKRYRVPLAGIKPDFFKNYFADLPASNSTRTGAIVFVAIDRFTRTVSFRQ
jgi:hypothetical protein